MTHSQSDTLPGNKSETHSLRGVKGQCHVGQTKGGTHSDCQPVDYRTQETRPLPHSSSSSCLCTCPRKPPPQAPPLRPALPPHSPKLAPSTPPPPHGTSAPGIWVLPRLQVVGERCQLPPSADAQPCASFLAFLHVEPWTDASITTSSTHPLPVSWAVEPQSHSPGCGIGDLTPQGGAGRHWKDDLPTLHPSGQLMPTASWSSGWHWAGSRAPAPSREPHPASGARVAGCPPPAESTGPSQ